MAKCAACGKYLSTKGGATCSSTNCVNRYHLACLLLPESTQMNSSWKCPDCKRKIPRGDNSATPVKEISAGSSEVVASSCSREAGSRSPDDMAFRSNDGVNTQSDHSDFSLREEIRLFRSELQAVRTELREFRREVAELHASFGICAQRVDSLEARIDTLERKETIVSEGSIMTQLQHTVKTLQLELNERDQDMLCSDLEISNLPEIAGENILHTVKLVASKVGVALEERDIVFAQRVGRRLGHESSSDRHISDIGGEEVLRGRCIVVRLARRALRDNLLQSARARRGANTADFGLNMPPRRFYINERLTKKNKHLFYRVREVANRLGWRFTWTKSGRILARQAEGSLICHIRSEEDFVRVFGCAAGEVKPN